MTAFAMAQSEYPSFRIAIDIRYLSTKTAIRKEILQGIIKIRYIVSIRLSVFICPAITFFINCIVPYLLNQIAAGFSITGTRKHRIYCHIQICPIFLALFLGLCCCLRCHILLMCLYSNGCVNSCNNNRSLEFAVLAKLFLLPSSYETW